MAVFKDSVFVRHRSRSRSLSRKKDESVDVEQTDRGEAQFTAQVLLLYYILLHKDTALANMKSIVAANRKVANYPPTLLAQLPIKHILHQAQKEQQLYAGLFSPLLRLVATHYPQLCLVEDWLDEELGVAKQPQAVIRIANSPCTPESLNDAFQKLSKSPIPVVQMLDQLLARTPSDLLPFVEVLTDNLQSLLDEGTPRCIQENVRRVWVSLNTVMPRKLRVMTVNALRARKERAYRVVPYTEDDITLDPLIVLRCHKKVFRCPPLLDITLRVLEAFLYTSRSYLGEHIQEHPLPSEKPGAIAAQQEMEELKSAMIGAQESAAIQMLLECCLAQPEDKESKGLLCDLREVQCLICSHLHQMFIADPHLAKLVHFQGYPSELLPVTVASIPSMHICIDFIPELLSQPHLDKQIFAIELVSHLSLQYALPKSLSIAKLALSVMATLIGVLTSDTQPDFFLPTLPAVVRICHAFPPLCEDAVSLLLQLGQVCTAHLAKVDNAVMKDVQIGDSSELVLPRDGQLQPKPLVDAKLGALVHHRELFNAVHKTFSDIVGSAALLRPLNEQA